MLKRKLFYLIPQPLRPMVRRLYYFPQDLVQKLQGGDELIPPKGNIFVGHGDFKEKGETFLNYFQELGHFQPHHQVLDVGCGIGRMAVPLMDFIHEEGAYYGFDIVQEGIDWCNKKIASQKSNFHFEQVDIYNELYNTKGKLKATEFSFPYPDHQFDFIFLTSVFTHMPPPEVEHYLKEISRVLKKGGHCFITYFLLDSEAKELINAGKSEMDFNYRKGHYRLMSEKVDAANVAYEQSYLKQLYQQNGLAIDGIHYGWWSGKEKRCDFQDIVVARKL